MEKALRHKIIFIATAAVFVVCCVLSIVSFLNRDYSSVKVPVKDYAVTHVLFDDENSSVIVATDDNKLFAINAQSEIAWQTVTEERVSQILCVGGKTYYTFEGKRDIFWIDEDGAVSGPDTALKTASGYPVNGMTASETHDKLVVISNIASSLNANKIDIFYGFKEPGYVRSSFSTNGKALFVAINESDGSIYYVNNSFKIYKASEDESADPLIATINFNPAGMGFVRGGELAVANKRGDIYVYSKSSSGGYEIKNTIGVGSLYVFATNPESNYAIAAEKGGSALLIDIESAKVLSRFKIFDEASRIYISQEGNFSIIQSLNKRAIVKNVSDFGKVNYHQTASVVFLIVSLLSLAASAILFLMFFPEGKRRIKAFSGNFFKVIKKHRISYLLLIPTLALLLIFNYYPVFKSFQLAFMDYKPGIYSRFVGFDNFKAVFNNVYFWTGIGNMLIFLVTDLLKALIPPVILAEMILAMRSIKGRYFVRLALFVPGILPGIAGILIWQTGILGIDGLVNSLLSAVGLGGWMTDWLGTPNTAIWALTAIGFPFIGAYLLFYGALLSVPSSLFEAAKIDGCPWYKRILIVDLPLIKPQLKYVFITCFIGSMQDFGRVYLTTMGGPIKSTYIPALELYLNISLFNNYGVASAMGILMFIVIFAATLMFLRGRTQEE